MDRVILQILVCLTLLLSVLVRSLINVFSVASLSHFRDLEIVFVIKKYTIKTGSQMKFSCWKIGYFLNRWSLLQGLLTFSQVCLQTIYISHDAHLP